MLLRKCLLDLAIDGVLSVPTVRVPGYMGGFSCVYANDGGSGGHGSNSGPGRANRGHDNDAGGPHGADDGHDHDVGDDGGARAGGEPATIAQSIQSFTKPGTPPVFMALGR